MSEWKKIVGFEKYSISKNGEVKTIFRGAEIFRKLQINPSNGYKYLHIKQNGKHFNLKVSRLVAKAFIPNPDNKPQVNHKDSIRTNDCVNNLEWVTNSENQLHARKNKVFKKLDFGGDKSHFAKFSWGLINKIRYEYAFDSFNQKDLGKKYNIPHTYIWSILHNKNWVDKNYSFKKKKRTKSIMGGKNAL